MNKKSPRPPVVTVMGHVDHGKTSLLSAIKEQDLTRKEFGGISQHIGAYQIKFKIKNSKFKVAEGKTITFIDTPGHAAFTQMRARGAKVTDIVILVVAANEGVKPQTKEALDHARAANVPIIVAINKIDLENADVEQVKKDLVEVGLVPEDWGGDTVTVEVSAKTKEGLGGLLEMILLVAEMQELTADVSAPFKGVVIESSLNSRRGPVATVLIKEGTLKIGEEVVSGSSSGKIKAMVDDKGQQTKEAGPSAPVEILGLDEVPEVGSEIASPSQIQAPPPQQKVGFKSEPLNIVEGTGVLSLVLKSDVEGTLEAISAALKKLENEEQKINILHAATGDVNESDILLAQASQALIFGFNVKASSDIKHLAATSNIEIRLYNIIYELLEDAEKALKGLLEEKKQEGTKGQAEIIKLFKLPHSGEVIIGAKITTGVVKVGDQVEVIRDGETVHTGKIKSIGVESAHKKSASEGAEAGILIRPQFKFKVGDKLALR